VLTDEPGTPAGCLLLRHKSEGLWRDWYVDPNKDYICVKQLEYHKDDQSEQWEERGNVLNARTELTPLPSGQWYAKRLSRPNAARDAIEFEVTLPTPSEMARLTNQGLFHGEKLLQEARDKGVHITFWAR